MKLPLLCCMWANSRQTGHAQIWDHGQPEEEMQRILGMRERVPSHPLFPSTYAETGEKSHEHRKEQIKWQQTAPQKI